MNAETHPLFFASPKCPELFKRDLQATHDIKERVHRNTGPHKREPVEARSRRWIAEHPQIYALFKQFALEMIGNGRKRYSAKAIVERVRWETDVQGGKPFKILNAATTYLALRFDEEHPQHAGFFQINKRKWGM